MLAGVKYWDTSRNGKPDERNVLLLYDSDGFDSDRLKQKLWLQDLQIALLNAS